MSEGQDGGGSVKQCQASDLERKALEVAEKVETWDATRFTLIKGLQEAARNFGQVLLMKDSKGGHEIAVKRMPNRWMCKGPKEFNLRYSTATEQPWKDLAILKYLIDAGFPYACELHGIYRSDTDTYVSTTFCKQGDLFSWCESPAAKKPGREREAAMIPIVMQICAGVKWMHELGIAHRDLSLENILLVDSQVKIIDFGMSTLARRSLNEVRGKASYQAPEMHTAKEPIDNFLTDAFAIGVVLYAMSAQDYPWTCTKQGSCQLFGFVAKAGLKVFCERRRLRKGKGETMIEVLSPELFEAIETLVCFDPDKRCCLGEVCFEEQVREKKRQSVWELRLVKGSTHKVAMPCSAALNSGGPGYRGSDAQKFVPQHRVVAL